MRINYRWRAIAVAVSMGGALAAAVTFAGPASAAAQHSSFPVAGAQLFCTNTTYTLSGYARVSGGGTAMLGVYTYGRSPDDVHSADVSSSSYGSQLQVTFTTGPSNTSAKLYCYRHAGATGSAQCDDITLGQNN